MDYADINTVKLGFANQTLSAGQLARLQINLTEASRAIDRELSQSHEPGSDNYLRLDTVAGETLRAATDRDGNIICYPHKPTISTVTALAYRLRPQDTWIPAADPVVLPAMVVTDRDALTAYTGLQLRTNRLFVQVSYIGGYAHDNHPEEIPDEIQRVAKVLAIRYYHEEEGGLNDAMGVTDFGTPVITKAMPLESKQALRFYKRVHAW